MCKLILVMHCSILYRFWDIQRRIMARSWHLRYKSLWAIKTAPCHESHASSYSSFIVTMTNGDGPILHRFRDRARYWLKIAMYHYHTPFCTTSLGKTAANICAMIFSQPSHIYGLSRGLHRLYEKSSVHSHLRRVTDRQTDRRTDRHALSIAQHSVYYSHI